MTRQEIEQAVRRVLERESRPRKEYYHELAFAEVLKGAKAKGLAQAKTPDAAATILFDVHEELTSKYLRSYEEVGEVSNTTIWDWISNHWDDDEIDGPTEPIGESVQEQSFDQVDYGLYPPPTDDERRFAREFIRHWAAEGGLDLKQFLRDWVKPRSPVAGPFSILTPGFLGAVRGHFLNLPDMQAQIDELVQEL